ncbi:MAG TPA: glycosyltransferase [Catalimonadaceae bacterium]|nr:glycosyltransferase [Catalimonadaceae bacterium]
MKVSGFTIARNVLKFDYPILEAIHSILPIVDEMVVAVGKSEDETLQLIQSISSPKIKIIETIWDDSQREGGKVLALETDKALKACSSDSDWCFYIQADEVMHEKYLPEVLKSMEQNLNRKEVEGLVFSYTHFYGSFEYVGDSRTWYRNEIRIIRNLPGMASYKDAQGFRYQGRKIRAAPAHAFMFHYGWVRSPFHQQEKQKSFHKLWHDDEWVAKNVSEASEFDYKQIDSLKKFEGTHPMVMQDRLLRMNWEFKFDLSQKRFTFKDRLLYWIERLTGYRPFEYKNYRLIK